MFNDSKYDERPMFCRWCNKIDEGGLDGCRCEICADCQHPTDEHAAGCAALYIPNDNDDRIAWTTADRWIDYRGYRMLVTATSAGFISRLLDASNEIDLGWSPTGTAEEAWRSLVEFVDWETVSPAIAVA